MEVKVIVSLESKFESTNRIYDVCGGGVQSNIECNARWKSRTENIGKGIGVYG